MKRVAGAPARVLYAHGWTTFHGGSATVLMDMLGGLDRARFPPTVLTTGPGALADRVRELGVPVVMHPMTALTRETVWPFVRETAWYVRFLRRERIALVHGNAACGRRSIVLAAWLCRVPYVHHVHNPASGLGRNFSYRLARRIHPVSEAIATPFRTVASLSRKTVTLHNAVDLTDYLGTDDRRAEAGGRRPVIGMVGQIVPRKGTATAIRAMQAVAELHPEAALVLVGCAPPDQPDYEQECRSLVATLGLERQVLFTGYRRDVPAWMRTFDVFVLPTRDEPFGKVIIEAMAAGRPVVASRVGGIPEIIDRPDVGVLVPPEQPDALARAVLGLLDDPVRAREMGEAARRHVFERFSLPMLMRRLEAEYGWLIAGGDARSATCDPAPRAGAREPSGRRVDQ